MPLSSSPHPWWQPLSRPWHRQSIRPRYAARSTSNAGRHDPSCHLVTSREFCQNACRMTAFTPTTPTPRLHLRLLSAIARPTTSSSTTPGSGTTRHTSTSRYAGTCSALMHLYTLGTHTLARRTLQEWADGSGTSFAMEQRRRPPRSNSSNSPQLLQRQVLSGQSASSLAGALALGRRAQQKSGHVNRRLISGIIQ